MSDSLGVQDWLRLDNAAKIYPASQDESSPPVFRVSVTLREPVRVRELQQALDRIIARAPYYQVHLRRGFFWYYLQRHSDSIRILPLPDDPIPGISLRKRNQQLLNVYARGGTVAIVFSHVLTDGYGAMRFLGSLIVEYLRLCGVATPDADDLLDPDGEVPAEEFGDSFQALFRPGVPKEPDVEPAYHIGGVPLGRTYRVITGRMPLDQALATAKRYGATFTEYLVAAYMEAIKNIHEQQTRAMFRPRRGIIRIEVPVNLRRIFPSTTMRNFSLFVAPEIDLRLGEWPFEEIVRRVHHEMNLRVNPNELARQISRNVGGERNRFVRILPRVVKYAYLGYLSRTIGGRTHSGVISNLGRFLLPEGLAGYVRTVGFLLGRNASYRTSCSVVSYAGEISVAIGSILQNRALERGVFRRLAADGIDVTISEYQQ